MSLRQILATLGVGIPFLIGCGDDSPAQPDSGVSEQVWRRGVSLPIALSNNAFTAINSEGGCMLYSFLGIDSSHSREGILTRGYRWREGDESWSLLPPIPGPPRLAANAVSLRNEPYLLGGYEVSEEGEETSANTLQRFNLRTGQWEYMAPIPTPIDDAGVVGWLDRYIVVVSGWSNTGNVSDVQIYDVEEDRWFSGGDFPGTPVFGQSAAIYENTIVVIDGVASRLRGFSIVNQAWKGTLDPNNPGMIEWEDLGEHPGPPRYRAAGAADSSGDFWFHGGTAEAYNYDGLRYDTGQPATPLATTLTLDSDGAFSEETIAAKEVGTMDHRALAYCRGRLWLAGGMESGPRSSSTLWWIAE